MLKWYSIAMEKRMPATQMSSKHKNYKLYTSWLYIVVELTVEKKKNMVHKITGPIREGIQFILCRILSEKETMRIECRKMTKFYAVVWRRNRVWYIYIDQMTISVILLREKNERKNNKNGTSTKKAVFINSKPVHSDYTRQSFFLFRQKLHTKY